MNYCVTVCISMNVHVLGVTSFLISCQVLEYATAVWDPHLSKNIKIHSILHVGSVPKCGMTYSDMLELHTRDQLS